MSSETERKWPGHDEWSEQEGWIENVEWLEPVEWIEADARVEALLSDVSFEAISGRGFPN